MRRKIDTSEVKFRVAGLPRPRQESRANPAQRRTPDGRLVCTVRLTAVDAAVTRPRPSGSRWLEMSPS
jgi:hypothetical protein